MTTSRYIEVSQEAQKRINLFLEHQTFEQFTCGFSRLRFIMALGLHGYPFKREVWMKDCDFNEFVTLEEWEDTDFDNLLDHLWANNKAMYLK